MGKLILSLVITTILTSVVFTQTNSSLRRLDQECRTKMLEQMNAEAKKFKMEVNPITFTHSNNQNAVTSAMLINNSENITEKELSAGIDLMLIYVNSDKPSSIPNGFYKMRIAEDKQKEEKENLRMAKTRRYIASFSNSEGRVIKQTSVNTGNNSGGTAVGYIRFGTVLEGGQWKPAIWFSTRREMYLYLYFGDL